MFFWKFGKRESKDATEAEGERGRKVLDGFWVPELPPKQYTP